ncbi:hypothetical protein MMC24_004276 [Lignoscripta atroalba]|nr:hypothetical protein [Lignoscripta atroalba]
MLSHRALVPIAPVAPDFFVCDPVYGTALAPSDCNVAGDTQLPQGQNAVNYYLTNQRAPNKLPFSVAHGSCSISVEYAGPDYAAPSFIDLVPDEIRGMAGYVINQCALQGNGVGGFITGRMADLVGYIRISGRFNAQPGDRTNVGFVTVTISGPEENLRKPGDTDPAIPLFLTDVEQDMALEGHLNNPNGAAITNHFIASAVRLSMRSQEMRRGGSLKWWETISPPADEMKYECDTKLGSPALVDCTKIEWQRLGPTSETVTLGPAATKFFSSNTCYLAISASEALTLGWSQLQTALETLMNTCVLHPLQPPLGGKAFFEVQTVPFCRKRTKRADDLTGLNALPPHVNLTIFAHEASSEVACEWQAAQNGRPVSSCTTA